MSWEKKIKPAPKKRGEFMVRLPQGLAEWIYKKSAEHFGVSGNKIIVAILQDAMEREAQPPAKETP
jgi:hypothetical protein